MAGGERRRATKSVAAATDEARCSNIRKAVTAGAQRPRPCAAGNNAGNDEVGSSAGYATETKVRHLLSAKEIRWILAQKPLAVPRRYAELKRNNPEALTPRPGEEVDEAKRRLYVVAKGFFDMEERFPKLQEWVREQLETKGVVEIDDEWAKRKADAQAIIDREWPKIEATIKSIRLLQTQAGGQGDEQSDGSDSDEEDD